MSSPNLAILLQEAKQLEKQGSCQAALRIFDEILSQIPTEAASAELKEIRLQSLSERGEALQKLGKQKEALANFQNYYLESGSNQHAIRALVKIGRQHAIIGDHKLALDTLSEAKTLAVALNDTNGRAFVHQRLGNYLIYLGRFEESLQEAKKSLALYEQLGDDAKVSDLWNNIGVCHSYLGVIDKSNQAYEKGLSYDISPPSRAFLLLNLGENYSDLYSMEMALTYHREALPLLGLGSLSTRADILRNIGVELFYLGQEDEALKTLDRSLAVSLQSQELDTILQVLASVAKIEVARENWEVALQHAEKLLMEAEKIEAKGHQCEAMFVLGQIEAGRGDFMKAEEYWQRGLFLAHETGKRYLLWQIHAGLADIAQSPALKQAHYQIAGDIIGQILYPIEDKVLRGAFLGAEAVKMVLGNAGISHLTP